MKLVIRPLTPELWPAFEDLFADGGPCSRCWCMYWRIGPAYRQRPSEANRSAFREIVERDPPPSLTPSTTSTGVVSTFERAGFAMVARRVPPRPVMRYDLDGEDR